MKKQLGVCTVGGMLILCAAVLVGCPPDGSLLDGSGCLEYVGEGFWPEYEGEWESVRNAAGGKHSDRAYLDVSIESDGTFSGIYYDYIYDYTWQMPTHWGNIPVSVYNPFGQARSICGLMNFDEEDGIVNFRGVGETTFTLLVNSTDSLTLVFPEEFHYAAANIQL